MPQDSRRSIGYRSFVKCDDPKGVVECGTIRRSKTSSQKMEQSIERQSTIKRLKKSSAHKTEREEPAMRQTAEESGGRTSFQLSEVSKGAQKLNKMIETWSKGLHFDGQYKDNIAKDLLKGALDLQESLVMLGKLQAATKYVAQLKQKQEKSEGVRGDGMGFVITKSGVFEDQNRLSGLQKPRLSDDGSSGRDIEELRKVIRESFARQNLLPSPVYGGEDYFHQRNTDSVSSMPSTSSSYSSTVYNDNLDYANSSFPSVKSRGKAKSPSVVAKLMGLEEFPCKLAQSPPRKGLEPQKYSLQERPVFDGVIPKMKKPENKILNVDMAQRTLREIVDTMQLKGLLRHNPSRKTKPLSQLFDECDSEERRVIDVPPIVLIKPISLPYSEAEEHLLQRERILKPESLLKTTKLKGEHASKPQDRKRGARTTEKMSIVKEEDDRPTQQGGEKKLKEDERNSTKEKILGKSSKTEKLSAPLSKQPLKKEAIGRRSSENEQAMKKEVSKSRSSPQSQETTKVANAKLVNPVTEVNRKKDKSPPQNGTKSKTKKPVTRVLPCNQDDEKRGQTRRMKEKPAREKQELKTSKMNDRECKDYGGKTDLSAETHSIQIEAISTHVDQQDILVNGNASDLETGENFSDGRNTDMLLPILLYERDNGSAAKACDRIPQSENEESHKRKCYVKAALLNDPSFLAHAEELFEFAQCPMLIEGLEKSYSGSANERLYLDFAKELIVCKSLQACQKSYLLLITPQGTSRICISMDKLLDEICDEIDDMNNSCEFASAELSVDCLYEVLKRDIWSKGVANGTWESGWRNGYSWHDAEQVVIDIERVLFSWLIEEVVVELSNSCCE